MICKKLAMFAWLATCALVATAAPGVHIDANVSLLDGLYRRSVSYTGEDTIMRVSLPLCCEFEIECTVNVSNRRQVHGAWQDTCRVPWRGFA
jgi:hypothetical protein